MNSPCRCVCIVDGKSERSWQLRKVRGKHEGYIIMIVIHPKRAIKSSKAPKEGGNEAPTYNAK
jgi:hypothetical protein